MPFSPRSPSPHRRPATPRRAVRSRWSRSRAHTPGRRCSSSAASTATSRRESPSRRRSSTRSLPPESPSGSFPTSTPTAVAAGTRQNAHGVDLNRNFPTGWRRQTGVFASGPKPLSEPESLFAYRLILRVRPVVSIWFHQHENLVDTSSGDVALERRFAALAGLPVGNLPRYGGSAVTWESHRFPGTTPFVVELPAGKLSAARVQRTVHAILALAATAAVPK